MYDQTYVERRGAMYRFRVRVPADVREAFGKAEVRESLGTKNKDEAKRRAQEKMLELRREWDALRERLKHGPKRTITPEEIETILKHAASHLLKFDEEDRMEGFPHDPDAPAPMGWERMSVAERDRLAVAGGQYSESLRMAAEDWLTHFGYQLAPDSREYRLFLYEFAKASSKMSEVKRARNRGEVVPTPAAPVSQAAAQGAKRHSIHDVVAYWGKQGKKKTPKTLALARAVVRWFVEANGDLPVNEIGKKHGVALRDRLLAKKAAKTVNKDLSLLKAMWQVCAEDEVFGITSNPFDTVKVRDDGEKRRPRDAYSVEQLNAIFASPIYTAGERPKGGKGEAAYWVPLLALFTGARLGELAQLSVDDVRSADGVTYLRLTNEGEGKRLKNVGSRRRVPVHPELLRLGFLDYVELMRSQQAQRLFPNVLSDPYSKWYGRYLDAIGMEHRSLVFHSFRHTFKHQARLCELPEDQHDALTGHANATVARKYGSAEGYPLGPLAKSIARLTFDGLRLPPPWRSPEG